MALPSVPNVIRIDMIHTFGEDANAGSRIFFSYTGTPTQAQMTQLASNVNIGWGTRWQPLAPSTVKLSEVIATDLASPAGLVGLWVGGTVGSRTGAGLTAETAAVINFKTGLRYRGGHPRNYMPLGVVTDLLDPQTWTSAFVTAMQTAASNFYAGVISSAGQPTLVNHVAVSYYSGGEWVQHLPSGAYKFHPTLRATPQVTPVAGYGIRLKPGSQRRRMLG